MVCNRLYDQRQDSEGQLGDGVDFRVNCLVGWLLCSKEWSRLLANLSLEPLLALVDWKDACHRISP